MAQFVVEYGERSNPAVEGTGPAAAAVAAGRRVRLGSASHRRRCRVHPTRGGGAVRRLVQLLLHHRHRDLAHLQEVPNGHLKKHKHINIGLLDEGLEVL